MFIKGLVKNKWQKLMVLRQRQVAFCQPKVYEVYTKRP